MMKTGSGCGIMPLCASCGVSMQWGVWRGLLIIAWYVHFDVVFARIKVSKLHLVWKFHLPAFKKKVPTDYTCSEL